MRWPFVLFFNLICHEKIDARKIYQNNHGNHWLLFHNYNLPEFALGLPLEDGSDINFSMSCTVIHYMPCRTPCRLFIHELFSEPLDLHLLVWSELGRSPPLRPIRALTLQWSWPVGHQSCGMWRWSWVLSLRGAAACLKFECPRRPWDPHLPKFGDLALAIRPDSRLQLSKPRKLVSRDFRIPFAHLIPFRIAKLTTPFLRSATFLGCVSLSLAGSFISDHGIGSGQNKRGEEAKSRDFSRFTVSALVLIGDWLGLRAVGQCEEWKMNWP